MSAKGLPVGERQPSVHGLLARSAGKPARHHRGLGSALVTCAKKREYGSGRARLPGLEEMMAAMQSEGSGAAPSGSSSGLTRPPPRPSSSSSGNGSSRSSTATPPAGGSSSAGEDAPSLGDYLKFGRLLGDKPQQVQQQLALGATPVVVDDESANYLQSWEEEEAEAYAMFEAVLQRQATRPAGAAANAAAKKLERNKARLSAAASAIQIERQARQERDSAAAPLSSAQRKLARNKTLGGGMGASMRASLEVLMGTAGIEGNADDTFELVSRPARPGAAATAGPLAAKPGQDSADEEDDFQDELGLDEEEAEYAQWAAQAEAEFGSLEDAYQDFEARLGQTRPAAPTPSQSKRNGKAKGGLAAVGALKDVVPQRPRGGPAQPPVPAPPSGRAKLQLGQLARPPKLAAKPQASSEARAAAQRPLPPPPPPEPKLASKPSRPAAPAAPARPAAPAVPPTQLPAPQLAAKPAVQSLSRERQQQASASETVPAASKPVPAAVPQQVAAKAVDAEPQQVARPAKPAPASAAADQAPISSEEVQEAAPPATPAGPAKHKRQVVENEAAKPAAAAAVQPSPAPAPPAVEPKLQRPALPPPKQLKQQRIEAERERRAALAERRAALSAQQKQRQENNAAYGHDRLMDRQPETLTVWQVNAAGVLVRNANLSGFIPASLLSPLNVTAVIEAERPLLAAAAAGAIVAQLETQGRPAQAADGADLDPATRASARRQALEAVLLGSQITALVVNVDTASGRVVLSERAAVSAWKDRGMRATPPSSVELQAAAGMLGEVVDATVVHVKPFGAFLEFEAELPSFMAAGATSERAPLVGLVHRSEISWDPEVSIMDALQVGQRLKAKLLHVDAAKGRIFLSIRRTTANPLLETLDSLVTSAAAASSGASSSASSSSAGGSAAARSEAAPAAAATAPPLDERPQLGNLPEAVRFCELLVEGGRGAVRSATPGVRLQSRAASQELEVYLAKDSSAGIGAAVAAVGGTAEPAAAVTAPADAATFNLVLRCARTVQEVALVATCSREEVRQLIASSISQLAAEVEAAAAEGV